MNLVALGSAQIQGSRPEMQDVVQVDVSPDGTHYLGVFDGHNPGGEVFAERAAIVTNRLVYGQQHSVESMAIAAGNRWITLNRELKEEYPRGRGGTTATLAVVRAADIAVAWLGDSEGAFYPDSEKPPIRLVKPHDGSHEAEAARVKSSGHEIVKRNGVDYFAGKLTLSRAIGDFHCDFVSPIADVSTYRFTGPGILVLGSDGIWGHHPIEAHTVEEIVRSHKSHDPQVIANELADLGWQHMDNASAIVARIA